jgi:hypothetical protein
VLHAFLGLSRDPFAATCDEDLYWEGPTRLGVRQRIEGLLRAGRGVWVRGSAGSGRRTLLARAAEPLALEGRPVAWCGAPFLPAEGCLAGALGLLGRVSGAPGQGDERFAPERVYEALVEGFCRGGPVIAALGGEALGPGDREELEFLAGLRVVGKPLICLALWGEASAPVAGLEEVFVPPLPPSALREILAHRAGACGRPDLLSPERLDRISAVAPSLAHALELARVETAKAVFRGGAGRENADEPDAAPRNGVLDPSAVEEVNRLFHALGFPPAAPG